MAAENQLQAATAFRHLRPGGDQAGLAPTRVVALPQHPAMFPSDCAQASSTCQRGAAELGLRSSETWGELDYKS